MEKAEAICYQGRHAFEKGSLIWEAIPNQAQRWAKFLVQMQLYVSNTEQILFSGCLKGVGDQIVHAPHFWSSPTSRTAS